MRIGIVGNGVVGHATSRCWMEFADVRVYDVRPERATHSLSEVLDSEITFLCLPTPQLPDGLAADVSAIDGFLDPLRGFTRPLVLKSTVPIGTTRRLARQYNLPNLVHSPEFLTARCAVADAMTPARNIVGGCEQTAATVCYLAHLYRTRFPGVPVHVMTSDESEAVKLFQNSFFATKIAFFNELHMLTMALGLDWHVIRDAVLADGRIAHAHTHSPGPDGKFGFGGSCLPKDLASLIDCMEQADATPTICQAVLERNRHDRTRSLK